MSRSEIAEFALQERERRDGGGLGAQHTRAEIHGGEARGQRILLLGVGESPLGPDENRDAARDDAVITEAVAEVVRRQVEVGIDIVSDGEMSKISYATYIARRLGGFAGDTPREPGQDLVEFPGLLRKLAERGATAKYRRPRCVAAVTVKDTRPLATDIHNLNAAAASARIVRRGEDEAMRRDGFFLRQSGADPGPGKLRRSVL